MNVKMTCNLLGRTVLLKFRNLERCPQKRLVFEQLVRKRDVWRGKLRLVLDSLGLNLEQKYSDQTPEKFRVGKNLEEKKHLCI